MPRPIHAAKRFCLLASQSMPFRTRSDDSAAPSVSGGVKSALRPFSRGMTRNSSFMFKRTRFLPVKLHIKTHDVINVPVGVIAGDSDSQQQNYSNVEIFLQITFNLATAEMRLPIFVQQSLLRR